ncbi:MAG: 2OG-Fe(II) oxygenase [Alphaproteobacteria bacterium]
MSDAAPARSFAVGDLLPRLVLLDRHGGKIDLGHQSLAGRIVVLGLGRADELDALAAVLDRLGPDDGTLRFCVAAGSQPGEPSLTDDRMLPDPAGLMSQAFAIDPPGWVVVDAGLRLAMKRPHDAGAAAAVDATVRRLQERARPETVRLQAPVLALPDLFEPAFCDRLLTHWQQGRKVTDLVSASSGASSGSRADAVLKRRADVPVDDEELTREIRRRLARRALPQIAMAFQRQVDHFETFRIGCYESGNAGYFGRHRDNTTPYTAHRLFALTANLNGDYAGGELVFPEFGAARYRPDPGGGVIFSCSLLHEALPVTAGRRFGLFGFLFDRAGAEQVGRVIAREQAAGRDPEAAWR